MLTTSSTGAPAATATTAIQASPADDIVGRYKTFWEIRLEANAAPVNPSDPRFAQYATGQQLENVVTETRQRQERGLAIRRPEPSVSERRVKVIKTEGETALLQDCATNDGVVYQVADGRVIDDKVVTRSLTATMRLVDGSWKLAETQVLQEWEGVAGCAKSPDFS